MKYLVKNFCLKKKSTCFEQIKSAYAVIRCQAKYASVMEFKCNDDWLTNHKTRDIKHWKDDNGVEHVSGSIKIKACFHFHRFFSFEPCPNLGRRSNQFGVCVGG